MKVCKKKTRQPSARPCHNDPDLKPILKFCFARKRGRKVAEDYAKKYRLHKTDLILCGNIAALLGRGEPVKPKWLARLHYVYERVRQFHRKGGAR